jgi:biopolymer transport protein ExbD
MHHKAARIISAYLVIAAAVCGPTATAGEPASREVWVTVQSDGTHCVVQEAKILCENVIVHLRDVLKLPPGSRVRLRAGRAVPHAPVKKVMDMLSNSEYPLPVALQ